MSNRTPTAVKFAEKPAGCSKGRVVGVVRFADAENRELGRTTGGEFTAGDELTVTGKVPKGARFCDVQFLDGPPHNLYRVQLAEPEEKHEEEQGE